MPTLEKLAPQTTKFGCGSGCLKTILLHHGISPSASASSLGQGGLDTPVSLAILVKTAEQHGLIWRALALSVDELHLLRLPAILTWGRLHFVVLLQISGGSALIFDPRGDVFEARRPFLEDHFGGVAVDFEPLSIGRRSKEFSNSR